MPDIRSAQRSSIERALATVRNHLSMDVAYLSEFVDGKSVFRFVDAPGLEHLAKPGDAHSLDDVYCRHILEGRLPAMIPDTREEPLAMEMPITGAVPIGSHMSIPVHRPDGEPYGMFCCLSSRPNASLNMRDLETMRMFADLAAEEVCRELVVREVATSKRAALTNLLERDGLNLVFQPILNLATGKTGGYEALSRFDADPYRPPNEWFDEAWEVGLGSELECRAVAQALDQARRLPDDVYVSVNASPQTIIDGPMHRTLLAETRTDRRRLILEVTEHEAVSDYAALTQALQPLRDAGVLLAIDDAGAGYSSMGHILRLQPDIIKLDMSLVRDIDTDRARRALSSAMVQFARELGIVIVAEGIETEGERDTLMSIGVHRGQGYHFAKPMGADEAFAYGAEARSEDERAAA